MIQEHMRQTTLGSDLSLRSSRLKAGNSVDALVRLLDGEEQLAFHAVIPQGNVLKCIAELLMRCASYVPVTVDSDGLTFVACDTNSGRLIHIVLHHKDLRSFNFLRTQPLRCTLESSSLHAVFHQHWGTGTPNAPIMQLKRRDTVVLYATNTDPGHCLQRSSVPADLVL